MSRSNAPLVVKCTFLDVPEEDSPWAHVRLRRRANTDSVILAAAGPQGYTPGAFSDSFASLVNKLADNCSKPEDNADSSSDTETILSAGAASLSLASAASTSSFASLSSASLSSQSTPTSSPRAVKDQTRATASSGSSLRLQQRGHAGGGVHAEQRPLDRSAVAAAGEKPKVEAKGRTTVMLRNMPNNYTRAMLLAMLDAEGFAGLFDFAYLPVDFHRRAGLGYAFVNLVDEASVQRFWEVFDGFDRWVIPTVKISSVSWSDPLQGLEANVERYRNSPVMHHKVPEEYRPVLFRNGERVEFPKPTKSIRPPLSRS